MARRRTLFQKKTAHYGWIGVTSSLAALSTTNTLFSFISSGVSATIRRIRGAIAVQIAVGAGTDSLMVAFGLAVVSDTARAVGPASMPSPIADPAYPWYWHKFVPLVANGTAADGLNGQAQSMMVDIDAKAMRKIRPDQSIVLLGDGLQQSGTPTARISVGWRVLFDNQ